MYRFYELLTELDGARKKVAIFGYMPQLGKAGFDEYDRIGEKVAKSQIDFLITIGAEAERIRLKSIENGFPVQKTCNCKNGADLYKALTPYLDKNHLILFKFPYKYRLSKFASFKYFMAKMYQD